ncbi:DUF7426 family protein [Actinomadura decatromicini]|uniref:DUF7426 domain-containing protein n=1 Tax=Actinomadura decatromicini TaxID=2604572 RepID=A0A5D3FG07_9ACTN|nr:hypothetical protein [Actinomadura decatromicini]TYK47153.1 hypothetical protein FXF68_25460 [Actinomadura decatromicini]
MAENEFEDVDELFDSSLTLPINGKKYRIPAVSGFDGLWAQRVVEEIRKAKAGGDVDAGKLNDGDERLLYERMLGPALDEMLKDGVEWERIGHAGMTMFLRTTASREDAQAYWKAGGDLPEADGSAGSPNRATRRASAAAARSTKKQGSTSGTRARKGSAKKRA